MCPKRIVYQEVEREERDCVLFLLDDKIEIFFKAHKEKLQFEKKIIFT